MTTENTMTKKPNIDTSTADAVENWGTNERIPQIAIINKTFGCLK